MSWSIDYSDWRIFKRFEDLNAAYEIGLREAPAAIYAETSYHVEEFLKGILPALLQMCIVQAASTAIGAGIGAGLGAFVFGAGAIPGAAIGAELGFDLGLAILGWLGLAFLAVAIGHSLGELVVLIKAAVVQAWGAADKGDSRSQHVRQAGQTLARAIAILVRLILTGIVAWLTKKGIDKAPELIAELKASKLGVGFAEWVEKNLGKLTNDPKLRGHAQGEGATTKAGADTQAQSPSQLAKKPVEEVTPPSPPKGKLKPGSPEHKADRWEKYQNRGGEKSYDQWSKQYDTNMRNYQHGLAREAQYREAMDATEGTLKTPLTNRQIDILKEEEMYAGQLKTGPVSLTKENALAIQKDAELVKQNWEVEHILEQGASKPYLDALKDAGIKATIGPKIP